MLETHSDSFGKWMIFWYFPYSSPSGFGSTLLRHDECVKEIRLTASPCIQKPFAHSFLPSSSQINTRSAYRFFFLGNEMRLFVTLPPL